MIPSKQEIMSKMMKQQLNITWRSTVEVYLLHVCFFIIPCLVDVLPAWVERDTLTGTACNPVMDILPPSIRHWRNPRQSYGIMGNLLGYQISWFWRWLCKNYNIAYHLKGKSYHNKIIKKHTQIYVRECERARILMQ